MKFYVKLLLLISSLIVTVGIIIGYLAYASSKRLIEEVIVNSMEDNAVTSLDKLDRMIYERYLDLTMLARDPAFGASHSTAQEISNRLKKEKNNFKRYSSLSYYTMDRLRVADTEGIDVGKKHALNEYWPGVVSGMDFVVDISMSSSLKRPTLHFAYAVRGREGVSRGVLVSRMNAEEILEIMRHSAGEHDIGGDFLINLVDRDGTILYSNYSSNGIVGDKAEQWDCIRKIVNSAGSMGSIKDRCGQPHGGSFLTFARESGYRSFHGNGWILLITIPPRVVTGPSQIVKNRIITVFFIGCAFSLLLVFLFSKTISRPLERLINAAREVANGNLQVTVDITRKDEIGELCRTFNGMVQNLARNLEDRRQAEDKIRLMSLTDDMTQTYNRRGFKTIVEHQLEIAKREGKETVLLYTDLDGLKGINDTLGHAAGDNAIMAAAEALKLTFRGSDVIARMGGDEFAVFAYDSPLAEAEALTARLQAYLDGYNKTGQHPYRLSISVGIERYDPTRHQTVDQLVSDADRRMYEQKQRKKRNSGGGL